MHLPTHTARLGRALVITVAAAMAAPLSAGEENDKAIDELLSNAEHCVSLGRIDRTDIVDDSNILFYMKGGDIYLNRLPHRCPGLRWEKAFMYRTSLSQLCNVDIITVLDNLGFGFSPGVSCGLGPFYPISEETAKALKAEQKAGKQAPD
jgi:hypothetical protein